MAVSAPDDNDWDVLSDQDWNEKLDRKIAEFNAGKGELKLPVPIHSIMDNEYERGILNAFVTEDLIRHFADAIGDPNPIWRDRTYAQNTRWGGIIAPPLFESCISFGSSFGGRLRVPGVARLAAGNLHEYFGPIRQGEEFHCYDKYAGFTERKVEGKPYRMFIESVPRYFVNQRDEVKAIATGRNIYLATPPSKRVTKVKGGKESTAGSKYDGKDYRVYSEAELKEIHDDFDAQLAGTKRQGKKVRYWEEVIEGQELAPLAKGIYDVCDASARTVVSCYVYAFAIKWGAMRNHLGTHPIDPLTGEHRFRRDWHYSDRAAQLFGSPLANAGGIHNEMTLVHIVTDWMGDDGFVVSMDSQDRRFNFFGDSTWVKGRVERKFVDDKGQRLVELFVWAENQDGDIHTNSTVLVKLPSRED
jgi:N-terminal half of MaoC dehydratase